jgi:hypothetical protein
MDENSSMDFYEKQVPKQKKGGSTFIIILLLLIIIGMGGYIAYDKGYLDNIIKKETKTEQKEESKDTTTELKEITDQNVIKTLDRNVEILNLVSKVTWLDKSEAFAKNQKNADLKEDLKLNSVLSYLEDKEEGKTTLTLEEYRRAYKMLVSNTAEADKLTQEDMENEDGLLATQESAVNNLFKSVYGYEPTVKSVETCPARGYDSVSKKYISIFRCGGTCGEQTLTYNYKYEEDEKNAYVYTALAVESCSDGIYKDYETKGLFEKTDVESDKEFKLDKSNYEQFSKYKITFTKSGTDYVFDSIELLK